MSPIACRGFYAAYCTSCLLSRVENSPIYESCLLSPIACRGFFITYCISCLLLHVEDSSMYESCLLSPFACPPSPITYHVSCLVSPSMSCISYHVFYLLSCLVPHLPSPTLANPALHDAYTFHVPGDSRHAADVRHDSQIGERRHETWLISHMQYTQGIADTLPITEGAPRLISNLKRLGYKVKYYAGCNMK